MKGADAPIEVAYVAKGSAGDAAGIQPGDELLS